MASKDVILICKILEKLIREYKKCHIFSKDHVIHWFTAERRFFSNEDMVDHIKGQEVEENHSVQLIKLLAKCALLSRGKRKKSANPKAANMPKIYKINFVSKYVKYIILSYIWLRNF